MNFVTRAYNSFAVNANTNLSIIKSSTEDRLFNESEYYKNIPDSLKIYFPRFINSTKEDGLFKLELEYYAYNNLGQVMLDKRYTPEIWEKIFDNIFLYIKNYKNEKINASTEDSYLMFVEKTEKEYEALVNNFEFFTELSKKDCVVFNGKNLKSFPSIWDTIYQYIKTIYTDEFNFIHGDFCFSNILYGEINDNVILKFIDPRGTFGNTKFYGDLYYDLAKLSHSVNGGYEYFIYDRFKFYHIAENEYELIYFNDVKYYIQDIFIRKIEEHGYDYRKIKLIEGLIYIGMCARHYDSLERQKAMYLTGLSILNEIYEEILL